MEEIVRVLCDLVAIKSVNPAMRAREGAERAEAEVADYVEDYMRRLGLDCDRQEVFPNRENVLIHVEGRDRNTVLLLEAHMDTVPGDTMTIEPFLPVVKEGRVYGRGACDDKANLTAMMLAVKEAIEHGKPSICVVLAAVVDEEHGYNGVKKLIQAGMKATFGIVGEPTDLDIVTAHKGAVRFNIRTTGVSAHSSNPNQGVNAIYRMARIIPHLEHYHCKILSQFSHPLVGSPTLSVGLIQGGQSANVVPDECEVTVDRRTLPNEQPLSAWEQVKEFLRSLPDVDFVLEFPEPSLTDIGMEVPEDSAIVRRLISACERVMGSSRCKGVAYGTDASKLTAAGIPTVVFGAGSILQAHAPVEFVGIEQLRMAKDIYREAIMSI